MPPRREPTPADRDALIEALVSREPARVFGTVERVSAELIGHRLFTVMRFDSDRGEVERVYSSLPSVYPVGGRKPKKDTAWADHVLRDRKVFRANDAAGIVAAFDDHATILGLGLASVLNIPLMIEEIEGYARGTMNLLHEAGWYGQEDEPVGLWLATYLLSAVMAQK